MELSIRDWLLIIGILLLMAVALDGLRRARNERRNQVRLSKNAKRAARKGVDDSLPNSELPNGGARLVGDEFDDEAAAESDSRDAASSERYQVDPLFTDPFEADDKTENPDDGLPSLSAVNETPADSIAPAGDVSADASPVDETLLDTEAPLRAEPTDHAHQARVSSAQASSVEPAADQPLDELLVLHVVASKDKPFVGKALQKILSACDCRQNSQNIFHRFEQENGQGKIQFSIVNMVEPGTFDFSNDGFSTAGISFFLRLPGAENPAEAYDCMIEIAQVIVRNLGGSLKDEAHSTATEQTLQHGRQRIQDYQKRKLLQS